MQTQPQQPDFWQTWQHTNATQAIFHQWQQLEQTGCIDNFRILATQARAFRQGLFFADSDAYKWLEAASWIEVTHPNQKLTQLIESLIKIIGQAQATDGYLFTYNQIHYPRVRWQNLQIEHELYCFGHLIEAAVSRFEASSKTDLLDIAQKAANCVVEAFRDKPALYTPGHEGVELALLRLYNITQNQNYQQLAKQFLEQRGQISHYGIKVMSQLLYTGIRLGIVELKKKWFYWQNPILKPPATLKWNDAKHPKGYIWRWIKNVYHGFYLQQHKPIRQIDHPAGHAVCFTYLATGITRLAKNDQDHSLKPMLEKNWNALVDQHLYVTGGLGSIPGIEGFGQPYELHPEYAYCESCAAIGSIFWSRAMGELLGKACYSDLIEWQFYNAALVGMGVDGCHYFYNNPLKSTGGITRHAWYSVPCCPSNLSRTYANMAHYTYRAEPNLLIIEQFITGNYTHDEFSWQVESFLPWQGTATITLTNAPTQATTIKIRRPSWSTHTDLLLNQSPVTLPNRPQLTNTTAQGFNPHLSDYIDVTRVWQAGDTLCLTFDMSITLHRAHPHVRGYDNKVAISRGPLVYAVENIDNIDNNPLQNPIVLKSLAVAPQRVMGKNHPSIVPLTAQTATQQTLTLIPYYYWGNRGDSQMSVWLSHTGHTQNPSALT